MSIPVLVLYRVRMRTSQKVSLGIFLCLSLVMACLAVIRASKIHGATSIDVVWEFYWQYVETVVAVIMGSLTVIRNLLVHQTKSTYNSPAGLPDGRSPGQTQQDGHYMAFYPRHKDKNIDESMRYSLPAVPAAILMGTNTFFRRNERESATAYETQITTTSILVQVESYQPQLSTIELRTPDCSYYDNYQARIW